MTDADIWETRYRRGDTGWDRGDVSPALYHWLDSGVVAPCRILVPGCGRGYEVVQLTAAGFDVLAVDIAPSAVASVRKLLEKEALRAQVTEADLLRFDLTRPVDAIYEQTCLCALPPARWPDYERRLHAWLRPGGLLLALFMQTGEEGGPPFHCDIADMRRLFAKERWQWPDTEPVHVPHPSGRFERGYVLRRKEPR